MLCASCTIAWCVFGVWPQADKSWVARDARSGVEGIGRGLTGAQWLVPSTVVVFLMQCLAIANG